MQAAGGQVPTPQLGQAGPVLPDRVLTISVTNRTLVIVPEAPPPECSPNYA